MMFLLIIALIVVILIAFILWKTRFKGNSSILETLNNTPQGTIRLIKTADGDIFHLPITENRETGIYIIQFNTQQNIDDYRRLRAWCENNPRRALSLEIVRSAEVDIKPIDLDKREFRDFRNSGLLGSR